MEGLSSSEAAARLQSFGPNSAAEEKSGTALSFFLAPFKSPLFILLIFSALLSGYFGETTSAIIILSIIVLSAGLDFLNSYKSDQAAKKLKERVRVTVTVRRDGEEKEVPVEMVVPGDSVLLTAGSIVPADGVVRKGMHCFANESSLTGESFPQPKPEQAELFMGSSIITGEASMEVVTTGRKTKFSQVVADVQKRETVTEFDREIKDFSTLILRVTFVLVIFVFVVNTLLKGNILTSLLFAVALAVGITPELLPMIITLNLAKGSLAMARRGVIVKKLSAIQNFGSMDVLCTDKTGTLTEDHIELVRYVDGNGEICEQALRSAYLNSVLTTSYRNPLDDAIRGFRRLGIQNYEKKDELPFDFERRRESVVVKHEGKLLLVTKGSPEGVMQVCSGFDNEATRRIAKTTYTNLSKEGFRVLAVATKEVESKASYSAADEKNMVFQGFIAFLDPPKTTVAKSLQHMQEHGINIKIVTGDNELVTQHIAEEIKLPITGVVLGSDLEKMSDKELAAKIEQVNVFARVNPEQKLRIIQMLQKNGHVVGYMGDGINDAPSLKAADIGISVNNATDIAKESADFILLHKSLAELVEGVIEGRKTFANTLKYLRMVLSSNFGNVFSMAGASLFLPFLPMLPTQILLNNLLYDVTQFALPLDQVDPEEVQAPRRLNLKEVKRYMFIFGPLSSVFDFLTFAILLGFGFAERQFQTGWFLESLATQILVIFVIRTKKIPFFQSTPTPLLRIFALGGVVIGWGIALSRFGGVFKFQPISLIPVLSLVGVTLVYLCVVQVIKRRILH